LGYTVVDISIINYRIYSERYIIFKENGKGKEYNGNNNKLLFEGEYKNRKRKGKDKEYFVSIDEDDIVLFEGKYLNNKIHGKGIEYFYNDKIIFKGEYFKGQRWKRKKIWYK